MDVGMGVRGGMLAALVMLATPVAATLVASPAFAQAVSSIQVEGNRRVEVETIPPYFKPGPGGRLNLARIDGRLTALLSPRLFPDPPISHPRYPPTPTQLSNPLNSTHPLL